VQGRHDAQKRGLYAPIFRTCSPAERQPRAQNLPMNGQARCSKKAAQRHQFFTHAARPKGKQGVKFANVRPGTRLKKRSPRPIFHTCSPAKRQSRAYNLPMSGQARGSKKVALRHQFFARAARPKGKQGVEFCLWPGRHEAQKRWLYATNFSHMQPGQRQTRAQHFP